MKFDTIKKNYKKQIIVGSLVTLSVISVVAISISKAQYKNTESIKLVQGNVNYKSPDLKTVALYTETDSGYQEANDIPTSGYKLNAEKSTCKVQTSSSGIENAPKDDNITIEYIDGKINFKGISKNNTRCYLYFDKINGITVDDIIAANNPKSETPNFVNAATTDEGVYSVSDGMYGGTSYYWRGAATTNYVRFANKCWRIIRINGDGSLRLIYDGTTCHANGTNTADSLVATNQTYNPSYDRSEYVGYTYSTGSQRTTGGTASNLKSQTDTWYTNNLVSYADKIADGKYCNDRNIASGYTWSSQPSSNLYYAGYDRSGAKSSSTVTPTLSCPSGDVYTIKAGAITMDEVVMAGGKWATANSSYYLYNGQYYWTMSPYYYPYAAVFRVSDDGQLYARNVHSTYGVRPVINLKAGTLFKTGGTGTQSNPYEVL